MKNRRVTFGATLNLTARVDQCKWRAVADGNSVEKTHALHQELEDVGQRQETEENVVRSYLRRVAKRFQSADDIFVRKKHAFRHSRRPRRVHDYGDVVGLRRNVVQLRRQTYFGDVIERYQLHSVLKKKTQSLRNKKKREKTREMTWL